MAAGLLLDRYEGHVSVAGLTQITTRGALSYAEIAYRIFRIGGR